MCGSCSILPICWHTVKYFTTSASTTRQGRACLFSRSTRTRILVGSVKGSSESFSSAVAECSTGMWHEAITSAIKEASTRVQLLDSHKGNKNPLINNAGHFVIAFCSANIIGRSSWLVMLCLKLGNRTSSKNLNI